MAAADPSPARLASLPAGDPPRTGADGGARDPHELRKRAVAGVLLVALALGANHLGGFPFALLAATGAALILLEWCAITGVATGRPLLQGVGFAILALAFALASTGFWLLALIMVGLGAAGLAQPVSTAPPLMHRWAGLGVIYAGLPMLAILWLRAQPAGEHCLLWLFAIVWATDIAGFFVGRAIGGPRLAPRTSPNKTWAGAIGGVAAAALVGALLGLLGNKAVLSVVALSILTSITAQLGDFGQSALKRGFGVKHSGSLIPGHGGVMDRLDGLIAAAPLVACAHLAQVWLLGGTG